MHHPFTVCFFGFEGREEDGRAWAIRTGLIERGMAATLCRTNARGFVEKYRDLYRMWKGMATDADALYVMFMGYSLMPLAWYLGQKKRIPVILDALISQYDTEVNDRKRLSCYSPRAWFLWALDFVGCHLADAIIVDTLAHKDFFARHFLLDPKRIIVIPIGCRSDLFVPSPAAAPHPGEFIVEFHGSFIPLQGVEYIMEAAKILQDKNERVRFILVGNGQTFDASVGLAKQFGLTSVEFLGRKPSEDIPRYISHGDVCLGIFGTTDKALRVIPNKVYECLSCGKAVITERSPAALERLRDRDGVYMVEPGNSADIAEKILELKRDAAMRERVAARAREISLEKFSPRALVQDLAAWLSASL